MGRNDTDFERKMREANRTADQLQARIDHQNKTDSFALALVLMTIGVMGLASLGIFVFSGVWS